MLMIVKLVFADNPAYQNRGGFMRKYMVLVLSLAVSLSFFISGCQKQDIKGTEENKMEMMELQQEQLEIGLTEGKSDGMVVYSSCPFMYKETEWELQTLVQGDMVVNGELTLDDRGYFVIQVISGGDSYVLFDEMVQLGIPEADVWIDEQEKLHIVLRDVRTAQYRVTDFIYDSEMKKFMGSDVLNGLGINYLGTTGK